MVAFMLSGFRSKIPYLLVALAVLATSIFKIVDLDFWWHLKTGQIILQQKAFQHTEIYSYTAAGREYVDHEWLFQVLQYLIYSAAGPAGIILAKTLILVIIYMLILRFLLQNKIHPLLAVALLLLSICGSRTRFIERPEIFSILFLICIYLLLDRFLKTGRKILVLWILLVIVLWSNIHAAVILGLLLQLFFLTGLIFEMLLQRHGYPVFCYKGKDQIFGVAVIFLLSILSSGINPTGYRVLSVPFELTAIIDSGLLNNQEWQPPPISRFVFFYLCIVLTFSMLVANFRRLHIPNFLLASFLGYISLKYVRNVGLFSVMMPIIISPYLADAFRRFKALRIGLVAASGALAVALGALFPYEAGFGVSSTFPERIVQFTKSNDLQGNMLNAYAFGGYFIWTLYPERKIFIDGRNEVYHPLLKEITSVRSDGRKWKNFLQKYGVEYALLNYVDELEEVTVMDQNHNLTKTFAPFSSTHFPRSLWALVYWDDNGMIFVRRDGTNQRLLPLEYTSVFPEGRFYHESLAKTGRLNPNKAIEELQRKLREEPACKRARHLLQVTQGSS